MRLLGPEEAHLAMQTARNRVIRVRELELHAKGSTRSVDDPVHDRDRCDVDLIAQLWLDRCAHSLLDAAVEGGGEDHLDPERIDLRDREDRLLVDDDLARGHPPTHQYFRDG